MIKAELIRTIEVKNTLAEGISWRETDQTVWWTDIQEKKLYTLSLSEDDLTRYQLPERLGSFGFVQGDDRTLICAFEQGFALYKPDTQDIQWIATPTSLKSGRRLNDGRVAPDGSFWVGSMIEDLTLDTEKTGIYRLNKGRLDFVMSGFSISNGLAWSKYGDKMYFSDSYKKLIFSSSYPVTSKLAMPYDIFAKVTHGSPDGAATDIHSRYWSAIWGAGSIQCFSEDAKILQNISVPAPQPTCVAFGGEHGNLLFVSSARDGLSASDLEQYPNSGNVFIYKTNTSGSPTYRYVL